MKNQLSMGALEWALLLVLSILWGGSFFFAKVALSEIPPLTLVFLRVAIAAAALLVFLRVSGRQIPRSAGLWGTFAIMGLLNNLIPFSLLFWGQTEIGAGLASIFNALAPIFTVLVAHMFLSDEKASAAKLIGAGVGLVGVMLMIGLDISQGTGFWAILAMIGCLLAAVSYGFASVYGRRFAEQGVDPFIGAFGQISCTSVLMIPVVVLIEAPWSVTVTSMSTVWAVLALALVSTALGYVIFFRILARGGATNISLVAFLIPLSAILLGALFLGERLASNHVLGMTAIFIGLLIIDGRLWSTLKSKFTPTASPNSQTSQGRLS